MSLFTTTSHTPSPTQRSSLASELCRTSIALRPHMEQNGITLAVSPLLKGRLLVADATANRTNAYKIRGALAALLAAQRQGAKSVWTASAGNHGAGVASSADRLGIPATVYVPDGAPAVKVEKIRGLGARVVHTGDSFDECLQSARAQERASLSGAHFIHPFDDFMVVAGQGTIGVELIEHAAVECARNNYSRVRFFLPIGGGGLAAGVASVIKTAWPKGLPTPEIIGVIDESSPAAMIGMSFGRQVAANPDTIADGTRVAVVGKTFLEVANLVDTVMLVPHDALVETMRRFHGKTGRMLEPAGALALTAERLSYQYSLFHDNDEALSIPLITGTNIDPTVFQDHISQPARLNQQSHARVGFDVSIPEMPGELLHFLKSVRPFNIASLTYKQASTQGRGTLRAEFEISRTEYLDLVAALHREFPGSAQLRDGQQMVFEVGAPIAADFRDELVTLKDRSGSFLRYVQTLSDQGELGTVGFLYYRKPSRPGADGQVVIGRH